MRSVLVQGPGLKYISLPNLQPSAGHYEVIAVNRQIQKKISYWKSFETRIESVTKVLVAVVKCFIATSQSSWVARHYLYQRRGWYLAKSIVLVAHAEPEFGVQCNALVESPID
jgi:hypothetical protein